MPITINGTTGISGVDGSAGTPALQGTDTNTGISFPAADTVAVNTGGSEGLRVDSSRRLLVGTSSTSAGSAGAAVFQGGDAGGNNAFMVLASKAATPASGDDLGIISFNDSAHIYNNALIRAQRDGGTWTATTSKPTRLVFSTTADGASSPTERMRIDNRGRVNVGGTGGLNAGFTVDWPANALEPVVINDTSNTAGQTHRISFRTGGTETGKIISGTTLGTSYVTSSDYRLKQGIVDLGDGVGRLAQLKPRRFSFINSPETVIDGFVAHEVQDIVPEAITGEKDAVDDDGNPIYQGIDHSRLVPLLTAALQEAVAEINALKDRVAALEGASPNP